MALRARVPDPIQGAAGSTDSIAHSKTRSMKFLVRAQNWLFRQILIYPLRNALLILALVALAGWGLYADGHALTEDYYPVLIAAALLNLGHAVLRRRRRRR